MNKRAKILLIVAASVVGLGAIAFVAGPPLYRDFIAAPAADAPSLGADDSVFDGDGQATESSEPLDAEALSGTWVIGEGSVAGYRVDEVLRGTEVTVTGRTSNVQGTIVTNGLTLEAAEFEVDVASIATDNASRDSYFRTQALRVSEHPTARFVLTEPVTSRETPARGEILEQELTGELTIAGSTQLVTFTAQFRSDGTTTQIAGQIPIVFEDYGVQAPSLGFVSVEPQGFVEFDLLATLG